MWQVDLEDMVTKNFLKWGDCRGYLLGTMWCASLVIKETREAESEKEMKPTELEVAVIWHIFVSFEDRKGPEPKNVGGLSKL